MKGAKFMQEHEPDVIVSVGGGSPIDGAKAMWIFYGHPETKFDDNALQIPLLRGCILYFEPKL